jgi:hypothetical protein
MIGLLFQELRDAVRMIRAQPEAAKDENIESPLQELKALRWTAYSRHAIYAELEWLSCQLCEARLSPFTGQRSIRTRSFPALPFSSKAHAHGNPNALNFITLITNARVVLEPFSKRV